MMGEPEGVRERHEDEPYVEYYIDHHEHSPSTNGNYRYAWGALNDWCEENGVEPEEITKSDVKEMCEDWESKDRLGSGTADIYINCLSKSVRWLVAVDEAGHNPFDKYTTFFESGHDKETTKMEVKLSDLRKFVNDSLSKSTSLFVYLVLLLKTGLRKSEALNLDLRDVHLDHPISEKMPEPREEVYNHPDTLFIDSSIKEGEEYNGEIRNYGNKPKSTRRIPIDPELKDVLVWWIAMIPPRKENPHPLFTRSTKPDGGRAVDVITQDLTDYTREKGYNNVELTNFGIDSHWCRHWFTTYLRANIDSDEVPIGTPKEYVEGLRGDNGEGVIETYTHEWDIEREGQKSYRKVFEDNVPKLFTTTDASSHTRSK